VLALLCVLHVQRSEGWKEKDKISPGGGNLRPKALYFRPIPIELPILLHPKPSPFFDQTNYSNDKMKEEKEGTFRNAKTLMADELWILANMG
jgi:hypothetical protein